MCNSYQQIYKVLRYLFKLICFQILHMKLEKFQTSDLKTCHFELEKCLWKPKENDVKSNCCQLSQEQTDKPLKKLI